MRLLNENESIFFFGREQPGLIVQFMLKYVRKSAGAVLQMDPYNIHWSSTLWTPHPASAYQVSPQDLF